MANLRQLGNFVKVTLSARATANGRQGRSFLLRDSSRRFSAEAEQPHPPASDRMLENPDTDAFYGKLFGITRHTMKSDVVNFLEGCNLKMDDIRVVYNRSFVPMGMVLQLHSLNAYNQANRTIARKGRLYRMERADRTQWDSNPSYDGKTLLLQGLPRTALIDDVERFLSGYEYDSSNVQLFYRQAIPEAIRMATITFPTQTQAMSAFLTKNRALCQNNQILARILQ